MTSQYSRTLRSLISMNSNFILLFSFLYAAWRQQVSIKLSGVKKMRGDINLVFHDMEGNSKEYEVDR